MIAWVASITFSQVQHLIHDQCYIFMANRYNVFVPDIDILKNNVIKELNELPKTSQVPSLSDLREMLINIQRRLS